MTITGPKPGGWALNEVLTSSQLTALQTAIERGIDGVGGGNYSPAAPIVLSDITKLAIASQSLVYKVPTVPAEPGTKWSWSSIGLSWTQTDVSGSDAVAFPVHLIGGDEVTQVVATVLGASGHSAMPVTRPRVSLFRETVATGTAVLVGFADDASGSTTAYQTLHTITFAAAYTVPSDSTRHYLVVRGESGANALAGLNLRDLQMTVVRKQLAPHQILF